MTRFRFFTYSIQWNQYHDTVLERKLMNAGRNALALSCGLASKALVKASNRICNKICNLFWNCKYYYVFFFLNIFAEIICMYDHKSYRQSCNGNIRKNGNILLTLLIHTPVINSITMLLPAQWKFTNRALTRCLLFGWIAQRRTQQKKGSQKGQEPRVRYEEEQGKDSCKRNRRSAGWGKPAKG